MSEPDADGALAGIRVLIVFHSFKQDADTLAFVKNERHLGAIPPLNLLYLSSWLRRHGAVTEVLDANAEDLTLPQALSRARRRNFDFVCFTATNLDFLFVLRWIKGFAREFDKPILLGGAAAENYPREAAAHPEISAVFHGPAEASVVEWLRSYAGGGAWWATPGTACRRDGVVAVNPPRGLPRGFVRPFPDRAAADVRRYYSILSKGSPFTAAMSAFGCPYGCEFCQIRRTPYFMRSPEDLVSELEHCEKELGIAEVDYFDSGFTVPRARAMRFAELYRRRGLRVRWSARARSDQVDAELLRQLKSANCSWLGYGIESGDDGVLANIGKTQRGIASISRALRMTREAGIGTVGFFVLGLPGETARTVENTMRFIKSAPLDFAQVSSFWPVPNTPIYDRLMGETGGDFWRLAITDEARQRDVALLGTAFTVRDMHEAADRIYREFYLRPSQLAVLLRNVASWRQLKNFAGAGLAVLKPN